MNRAKLTMKAVGVLALAVTLWTSCNDDTPASTTPRDGASSDSRFGNDTSDAGMAVDTSALEPDGSVTPLDVVAGDGAAPDGLPSDGSPDTTVPPLAEPGPLFCGRPGLVFSGQEVTVDVFSVRDGLIVVRRRSLLLIDRLGRTLRSISFPRDVVAAAFDGTTLTVADRALIHTFRRDLVKTSSRPLTDPRDSFLLLPDGRLLCGATADPSNRYVYGPGDGQGTHVGFGGVSGIRRVPGRSAFVAPATRLSYLVPKPNGDLEFRASAKDDGKVISFPGFAFFGEPVTHVIDVVGNVLKIDESECLKPSTSAPSGCFTFEGQVGSAGMDHYYAGLLEDSPTTMVGLLTRIPTTFHTSPCLTGCQVQRIDVAGRKVLSERTHRLDARIIKVIRNDSFCDRLLVLSRTTDESTLSDSQGGGDYRVHLLDHSEAKHPEVPPADHPRPSATVHPLASPPAARTTPGPCAEPRAIFSSDQEVLAAEPVVPGIVIVTPKSVTLVGREGLAKATATSSTTITAAAIDGTRVVIADAAPGITVLSLDTLTSVARMTTPETCGGLVLLDGARVVCGGASDVDRIFYTLDLDAKTEIARSGKYTYKGLPMHRVPGRLQFVTTQTNTSSHLFGLFELTADGTAAFVNDSAGSRLGANHNFAFLGQPADRIVGVEGGLARLEGPECKAGQLESRMGCFAREGQLGVLPQRQGHLSMASDDAGMVYALAATPSPVATTERCGGGCVLQQIDVANRRIVSERAATLPIDWVHGSRFDRTCGTVVLRYRALPKAGTRDGRFVVETLDFRVPGAAP